MNDISEYTILQSWPHIKKDLETFLKDPYKYVEVELKNELSKGEIMRKLDIDKLSEILEMVNRVFSNEN